MANNHQASVEDDYFNDLSRQPNRNPDDASKSPNKLEGNANREDHAQQSKVKRVACVICRKRKLKCDSGRPSCGTCSRLGHNCTYDEVRRKSGPKRGYVKELEARLAQVETQLKTKDAVSPPALEPNALPTSAEQNNSSYAAFDPGVMNMDMSAPMDGLLNNNNFEDPASNIIPDIDLAIDENFSWEMIGLGLEEPLPSQEAIDELTNIYFEKIHPSIPIIHKYRFSAGMNLSPHMRPSVCLRYAMWCNAASVSDRYSGHQDILYRRARKYIELDEMRGQGEGIVSVGHSQTWSLLGMYEFKNMYFPRAWMSVARACRLALMMGMNRVDGHGMDVKQCLPPPRDWTEREERRRAFWMAYCCDRFASVGTGWPMVVDEGDIMTNLPASEEAYQSSTPQTTQSLAACMTSQGAMSISSFGGVVFMAHFFGKNLHHLHRPGPDDREHDVQGDFWKRHRNLDNILLQRSLALPPHLRLPFAVRDGNAIFINMAIHTSTICLHQAAIFKAEKHGLPQSLIEQSQTRCTLAATEITNTLKLISHIDTDTMNPYLPFCLFLAARVFVQLLKKVSGDSEIRSSLEFLLTAMDWLRRHNPLSESFLVQLTLDMRGGGLANIMQNPDFKPSTLACGGILGTCGSVEDQYWAIQPKEQKGPEALSTSTTDIPDPQAANMFPTSSTKDNTFDIPSREQRPIVFGIFPGHGNTHFQAPEKPDASPGGYNPYSDTQDGPSPRSNPTPSALTPGESQHASSATSYSPGREEDPKPLGPDTLGKDSAYCNFLSNSDGLYMGTSSGQDGSSNNSYQMYNDQSNTNDAFTIPPGGWDLGTGTTPLPSGMTPAADGSTWANMNAQSWNNARSTDTQRNAQSPPRFGFQPFFDTDTLRLNLDKQKGYQQ